jgi:hypothetical protein
VILITNNDISLNSNNQLIVVRETCSFSEVGTECVLPVTGSAVLRSCVCLCDGQEKQVLLCWSCLFLGLASSPGGGVQIMKLLCDEAICRGHGSTPGRSPRKMSRSHFLSNDAYVFASLHSDVKNIQLFILYVLS